MKTMFNPRSLFVLILPMLILVSCDSDDASEETAVKRTPVRVVPVQKATLSPSIRTAGRLSTKAESRLSFKTGGILSRIAADEGKDVKKGQLLAQLDMREINAQVKAAKSAAEKAERDLKRVQALYADSVATLEQLQNAETGRDVAVAQLEVAKFNQQYSSIFAPANGRVLKRFAERNELISPGAPIFTFSSSSDAWIVRCGVSEIDLIQIALGDKAEVSFDPYPNQTFSGTVSEVATAADPRNGTFEVEIRLADTSLKLISGFVATVQITPSASSELALIPSEALVEGDGYSGNIFLADGNVARKTQVDIAHILEDGVALRSSLNDEAIVITDGSAYLRDGDAIDIIQ